MAAALVYLFVCAFIGAICAIIANGKGRSGLAAFFIGTILAVASWTIAGIATMIVYAILGHRQIFCPMPNCGESNHHTNTHCKRCGAQITRL